MLTHVLQITGLIILVACASPSWAQDTPAIANFDGTQSLTFPAEISLDLTSYGAVEMWVLPQWRKGKPEDAVLLSYLGLRGPRYAIVLTADQKHIGIYSGVDWDAVPIDFSSSKLRHLAFNFLGQYTDVYIDGEYADTIEAGIANVPATHLHIGSINGANMAFSGRLGGVRIWDMPLDPDDIASFRKIDIMSKTGVTHPDIESLVGASQAGGDPLTFALMTEFQTEIEDDEDTWKDGVDEDPPPLSDEE